MPELNKIIEIYDAIVAHNSDVFDSLTVSEKMTLAAKVREAQPTGLAATEINNLIAEYRALDTFRGANSFSNMSLFDKLMIAAQARRLTTAGAAAGTPTEAVTGVAAKASLIIGGEDTASDIAEGDTITIGSVIITAIADDETPVSYQFCVADTKEEVADNIFACLAAIPGNTALPWTFSQINDVIWISARETGIAGNLIAVSVETEGDTAFSSETLTGGIDAVEQSQGFVMVDADGNFHVKVNGTWVKLLTEYSMPLDGALPEGLKPDRLHIDTGVITDDISAEPLTVTVPDGYSLEKITLKTGALVDPVTNLAVHDTGGDVIAQNGSFAGEGTYMFYPIASSAHSSGDIDLYVDDNTTPGISFVLSFSKIQA